MFCFACAHDVGIDKPGSGGQIVRFVFFRLEVAVFRLGNVVIGPLGYLKVSTPSSLWDGII